MSRRPKRPIYDKNKFRKPRRPISVRIIKEIINKRALSLEEFSEEPAKDHDKFTSNLDQNLRQLQSILGESPDIIIRRFSIGNLVNLGGLGGLLIFVDGLADKKIIDEQILKPLMVDGRKITCNANNRPDFNSIEEILLTTGSVKKGERVSEAVTGVLAGDTVILVDGFQEFYIVATRGWEKRAIEEPQSEVVVRGPREGFTETLRTNTALIRRKIHDPNLTFECMSIGERTKTEVCIAYIKGIADDSLITEIRRRLKRIKTDSILESGYIEEFIEDAPFSIFPTVARSERPDAVAGKILEGRAAIIVAGTPFVLTVPMLFVEVFQSPEDYYSRAYYGTLIRWVRYAAFVLSLLMPAIYVALVSFHLELVPTPLLITLAAAREGLPFPPVVEAIIMGLIFEILREAGIRLPRPIGQAISIVGALVIGQAVVSAGLVGAPMVIVIALTAIASFVIPHLADSTAFLRVILTILAGILGAYGIIIGLLALLIHLASLRSFGAPYLSPAAPFFATDLKDAVGRVPWWAMFRRSHNFGGKDPKRQEFRLMPRTPANQGKNSTE